MARAATLVFRVAASSTSARAGRRAYTVSADARREFRENGCESLARSASARARPAEPARGGGAPPLAAVEAVGPNRAPRRRARVALAAACLTRQSLPPPSPPSDTVLKGFLTEHELAPLDAAYAKFMRREVAVPGKDFCDMSQGFDTPFEQYRIVNAMLPTKYLPSLKGNTYEVRAAAAVKQLLGRDDMVFDYDQLLDKRPRQEKAVFAWHQDMAYWPGTPDTATATFSLALDATTRANGCLKFVPGSQLARIVRPHKPVGKTRDDAHAIAVAVDEAREHIAYVELARGDVSVHDEYVVHGSGGNSTPGHRRTYVCAFRTADTVARERAAGFTHSHLDSVNWDSFNKWQADTEGSQRKTL